MNTSKNQNLIVPRTKADWAKMRRWLQSDASYDDFVLSTREVEAMIKRAGKTEVNTYVVSAASLRQMLLDCDVDLSDPCDATESINSEEMSSLLEFNQWLTVTAARIGFSPDGKRSR